MSVVIDKDCVTMPDGTMYCWDAEDKCCYMLNKKVVGIRDVPEDVIVRLLELAHSANGRREA